MKFAAVFFAACLASLANASYAKEGLSLVQALKLDDDFCDCNECSAECIASGFIGGVCATNNRCYCAEESNNKVLGLALPNIKIVNDDTCECNQCGADCVSQGYDGGLCFKDTCYCGEI